MIEPIADNGRCEALFASGLQRSEALTTDSVEKAISRARLSFGVRGCTSRMAQEFGDHPQEAVERMRWVRQIAAAVVQPSHEPRPQAA